MVTVTLSGLPSNVPEHMLLQVRAKITCQMVGLPGLGLSNGEEVELVIPSSSSAETRETSTLSVHVYLKNGRGQTDEVYGGISRLVGAEVMHQFPFRPIELFMHPFRPSAGGYWQYTP